MGAWQVLPLRFTLGVKAMKGYRTISKYLEMESLHQIQCCVLPRTRYFRKFYPSAGDSISIFWALTKIYPGLFQREVFNKGVHTILFSGLFSFFFLWEFDSWFLRFWPKLATDFFKNKTKLKKKLDGLSIKTGRATDHNCHRGKRKSSVHRPTQLDGHICQGKFRLILESGL